MDVARSDGVPVVLDELHQSRHHLGLVLALEGMQYSLVAGLVDGRDVGRSRGLVICELVEKPAGFSPC